VRCGAVLPNRIHHNWHEKTYHMSADQRGWIEWMERDDGTRRGSEQIGVRWSAFERDEAKRDQRLGAELGRMTSKLNTLHENYMLRTGETMCELVKIMEINSTGVIKMTNIIVSD